MFLILLVARNASISFAEYIIKHRWLDEKKLYQTYAVSTLLVGLTVVLILSSIVSGAGVDLSNLSFSLSAWLTSAGSLPYVIGVLVIGVGLAPVLYGIAELRRWTLPLTVIGVVIEALALYLYSSSFLTWQFLIPGLLTIAAALLYQFPRTAGLVSNKAVFGVVSCAIIFAQSYLVYPTAFHGAIGVDSVTATGPMYGAFLVLSAAGVVIVGLLMLLYMFVVGRAGGTAEGKTSPTTNFPVGALGRGAARDSPATFDPVSRFAGPGRLSRRWGIRRNDNLKNPLCNRSKLARSGEFYRCRRAVSRCWSYSQS